MLLPLLSDVEEVTTPAISAIDPINKLVPFLGEFNIWTILIRLILAFLIGALFGFERSRKRHTAGFRTFIFVALFSTIAALTDVYFSVNFGEIFPAITTAVVLGGAIAGFYTAALIGVVLAFITLNAMPKVEVFMKDKSNHFEIHLELKNRNDLVNFTGVVRKLGLKITDIEANPAYANTGLGVYTISLTIKSNELKKYKTHKEIIEALQTLEYINCIEEID